MKAREIVRDALLILRVIDAAEAVPAELMQDGLDALNGMVLRWEQDGIPMGWAAATDPETVIEIDEAREALAYNLALRLRSRFGVTIEPDVVATARDSMASLTASVTRHDYARLSYPDLP